jgi:hypothetical protein
MEKVLRCLSLSFYNENSNRQVGPWEYPSLLVKYSICMYFYLYYTPVYNTNNDISSEPPINLTQSPLPTSKLCQLYQSQCQSCLSFLGGTSWAKCPRGHLLCRPCWLYTMKTTSILDMETISWGFQFQPSVLEWVLPIGALSFSQKL